MTTELDGRGPILTLARQRAKRQNSSGTIDGGAVTDESRCLGQDGARVAAKIPRSFFASGDPRPLLLTQVRDLAERPAGHGTTVGGSLPAVETDAAAKTESG